MEELPKKAKTSKITVRPIEDNDVDRATELWIAGLAQTSDEVWTLLRPAIRWVFAREVQKAIQSEMGDMGSPNLIKVWRQPKDRMFFVAEQETTWHEDDDDDEHGRTSARETTKQIVGCVAVKKKDAKNPYDMRATDPNSKVASIWRLAVDESVRRQGIATQLMAAAETWAVQHGCTSMWLTTANPRGADFYKAIGYTTTDYCGLHFIKRLDSGDHK